MSIKDDIMFDQNGFVPPADVNQPFSDNGVLFTSQYYLLLAHYGCSMPREEFYDTMGRTTRDGNITRWPGNTAQEGPDDYIGLCAASRCWGTNHASLIYAYGRKHFWNYNTENPGKFTFTSWLGRQPGLIGFIKYCAGRVMSPLEFLALHVGILISAFGKKEETSDKLLALTMLEVLKDHWIFRPINTFYLWRIRQVYGSVNNLVRAYFGPAHPFSKWWT